MMNNNTIAKIIEKDFKTKTVLVIGDLMVDQYVTGSVSRISPEAPVPVLNYINIIREGGGACNVALNLKSLGCNVIVAGVAANDEAGKWLRQHLDNCGIKTDYIIEETGRPTTIKTRYATKGQQLLRVDTEKTNEISIDTKRQILTYIEDMSDVINGVIISDYRKGIFNSIEFVKEVISFCKERNIITAIDSKSRNITAFENVDIVKPNNIELENAVNVRIVDEESFNKAGELYLSKSKAKTLLVTRGSKGISIFRNGKERTDFPASEVQVYDVTGAGDTVISTVILAVISGLIIEDAVKLANIAAGIVISKVGTVAVTNDELIESMLNE